jgi:hypothetical protein
MLATIAHVRRGSLCLNAHAVSLGTVMNICLTSCHQIPGTFARTRKRPAKNKAAASSPTSQIILASSRRIYLRPVTTNITSALTEIVVQPDRWPRITDSCLHGRSESIPIRVIAFVLLCSPKQ